MSSLGKELLVLILQFLDEEKFKGTVHRLEQESGLFFNMKYFEEEVHKGNWDEIERYLSGFTKVSDNMYSLKVFFDIRKQKYLEALDKHDLGKATDILIHELKVFQSFNEELFKEITYLLTMENFRYNVIHNLNCVLFLFRWLWNLLLRGGNPVHEAPSTTGYWRGQNEQLSKYGDTQSARAVVCAELKKLIVANPLLQEKLKFPNLEPSRLRTLVSRSLNFCSISPIQVLHESLDEGAINSIGDQIEVGGSAMTSLRRELVFLILQFLDEEKYKETVHRLEQESGFFFNMKYFEGEVHKGNWDEVERYLSGFTKVQDNRYSLKMFFEIRKQKYLEALDKHDRARAYNILKHELKVFESYDKEVFKEISSLLIMDNFRQNDLLSDYRDTQYARAILFAELKIVIEGYPLMREKLKFPILEPSRLWTLVTQRF